MSRKLYKYMRLESEVCYPDIFTKATINSDELGIFKEIERYLLEESEIRPAIFFQDLFDYDAAVYVIKVDREYDNERFWYVGKTGTATRNKSSNIIESLIRRIKSHRSSKGNFKGPRKLEDGTTYSADINFWVDGVERIEFFSKREFDYSVVKFKKMLREQERKIMLEEALDKDTTNILGGK